MPMMAVNEQNDARSSARFLAMTTSDCLTHPVSAPARRTVINNMYRLLEAYRSHGFYAFDSEPEADDEFGAVSLLPSTERHVGDVKRAFEASIRSVYPDEPSDDAIASVEAIMRAVTYPGKAPEPEAGEFDRARRFFDELVQHLRAPA